MRQPSMMGNVSMTIAPYYMAVTILATLTSFFFITSNSNPFMRHLGPMLWTPNLRLSHCLWAHVVSERRPQERLYEAYLGGRRGKGRRAESRGWWRAGRSAGGRERGKVGVIVERRSWVMLAIPARAVTRRRRGAERPARWGAGRRRQWEGSRGRAWLRVWLPVVNLEILSTTT